ncbi:MAG: hypothetical protein ACI8RD_011047 [Bacillariaceae sp.]|jgi:hypothetical protein
MKSISARRRNWILNSLQCRTVVLQLTHVCNVNGLFPYSISNILFTKLIFLCLVLI